MSAGRGGKFYFPEMLQSNELEEVVEEAPIQQRSRGRELLRMTIDLGQGRTSEISVHESDEPSEIAGEFCRRHALSDKLRTALERNIESNLRQISEDRYEPAKPVNDEVDNYGELLYYKGIRMKENAQMIAQKELQKRQVAERRELTFRPTISRSVERMRKGNLEDELILQSKVSKEHLEKLKQEAIKEEALECTFVPHINQKSLCLAGKPSGDNFQRLYQDAKLRVIRHERASNEMKRKELSQPIDPVTGQELFRPQTGRPPREDVLPTQRKKDLSITEYLYQKKPRPDLSSDEVSPFPAPLSRTKSENILRRRKEGKYQELFNLLKPEGEETLTGGNVVREKVSEEVFLVIKPLIDELVSVDESLTYPDFSTSMDNLMERLTPSERATLLGIIKKPPEPQHLSFKPAINKYKPQPKPASDLYERETARRKALEMRLKAQKESKKTEETAECTFKPKVTKYVPRRV